MYQESIVLCAGNAYNKMYYLNEDFNGLPEQVKNELKIMCVLFTEEIGGILSLEFDDEGNLLIKTNCEENDYTYDEIGSGLKVKQIQNEKKDLLEALETYYKVFFLE